MLDQLLRRWANIKTYCGCRGLAAIEQTSKVQRKPSKRLRRCTSDGLMLAQRRNIQPSLVQRLGVNWESCGPAHQANTRHSPNAVSMLVHCRRRWPNTETALGECLVSAGQLALQVGLTMSLASGADWV